MNTTASTCSLTVPSKAEILKTILDEQTAVSGRAGETPLTKLANRIDAMKREEALIFASAIHEIIVESADDHSKNFWRSISFLIQYLPFGTAGSLVEELKKLLFRKSMADAYILVQILNSFLAGGGILTEQELLDDLRLILNRYPVAWVNAAVKSSLLTFAEENIHKMVSTGEITLAGSRNEIILHLDYWRTLWSDDNVFIHMVKQIIRETSDQETAQRGTKWLERRKIPV